jgi:hypothetical protein
VVGVHERGEERVGMRFDDDAGACEWLYRELVFADPPPRALSGEEERQGRERTAALIAEAAASLPVAPLLPTIRWLLRNGYLRRVRPPA